MIKMDELHGEKRSETLQLLHDACAQWGFFWVSKRYNIVAFIEEFLSTTTNMNSFCMLA